MEGLFCFKGLADGFRIVADGMQGLWKTRRGKGMKHREKRESKIPKFAWRLSDLVFKGCAEAVFTLKTAARSDIFHSVTGCDQIKFCKIDPGDQNITVGGISCFFLEFPQKIVRAEGDSGSQKFQG